ncbi:MAG TPA: FecR domain-containing protein [Pseudobacter sp.]|nr:FecR domain-containing protein [Pseudobacter sp.]
MDKEKIIALIEGYADGTLTEEEQIIFLRWYSEADAATFHGLLMESSELAANQKAYPEIPAGFRERLRQAVQELGSDDEMQGNRTVPMFRRFRLGWAAAILLAAGIGGYLWFEQHSPGQQASHRQEQQDAFPGTTKAVLTLSDGRHIMLDSASNGELALEGNTSVINNNGTITYSGKTAPIQIYNTITTARGQQSPPLTLSDGTKVWLNALSSIHFPVAFTGDTRLVEITGEAYFEVAGDARKPFLVRVNDMEVNVLGTRFNVNAYPDEAFIGTTLLDGSVRVSVSKKNGQELVLSPGSQAQVLGGNIKLAKEVDLDQVIAWKNGQFNFNQTDLQAVLRQLSRWYDIDMKFEGEPPVRSFRGKITKDLQLSEVLKVLEEVDVKFRIEGRTLIVTQ